MWGLAHSSAGKEPASNGFVSTIAKKVISSSTLSYSSNCLRFYRLTVVKIKDEKSLAGSRFIHDLHRINFAISMTGNRKRRRLTVMGHDLITSWIFLLFLGSSAGGGASRAATFPACCRRAE